MASLSPMSVWWRLLLDVRWDLRTFSFDVLVFLILVVGKNSDDTGLCWSQAVLVLAIDSLLFNTWSLNVCESVQTWRRPCKFQVLELSHVDLMGSAVMSVWNFPKAEEDVQRIKSYVTADREQIFQHHSRTRRARAIALAYSRGSDA